MRVMARGCSDVSGEGCGSWLHGGAALRNILKGGVTIGEWLRLRWSACVESVKAEGNRTTHLTRPPAACLSSWLVGFEW